MTDNDFALLKLKGDMGEAEEKVNIVSANYGPQAKSSPLLIFV